MIGGTIIEIVRLQDKTWVNCQNGLDLCAIYVEEHPDRCLMPGDELWWLDKAALWTTTDGVYKNNRLTKIGYSGAARPTETRVSQALRQMRAVEAMMKKVVFV